MRTIRVIVTAVAVPVLLSACGGGSDGNTTVPLAGGPAGDGSGFTTIGKTFFNEDDGIKFADALGGSFSDVFEAIAGGLSQNSTASSTSGDSISQRMKRATESESIACESSGSITNSVSSDAAGQPTSVTISFNDCVNGTNRANGSISFTVSGTETNQTVALNFNNFRSIDNGENSAINGGISINVAETGGSTSTTISGSNITMVTAGETVILSNYSLKSTDDVNGGSSLEGGSTITTGAGALTMSISPALTVGFNDDYPTSGVIAWSHSDGSSLSINADSGDANTFNYVISDGATTTSGVGNWSETDIGEISL